MVVLHNGGAGEGGGVLMGILRWVIAVGGESYFVQLVVLDAQFLFVAPNDYCNRFSLKNNTSVTVFAIRS